MDLLGEEETPPPLSMRGPSEPSLSRGPARNHRDLQIGIILAAGVNRAKYGGYYLESDIRSVFDH